MNFRSSNHFLEFSIIGRKFCSRDDRHVALPAVPGWSPGQGHSGHAAQPECARGNTLAGHVAHSEASGEFTLAGLAAHSGASGRVLCAWVLGTRGVLGRSPGETSVMGVSGHVGGSKSIREGFYGLGTRG